METKSRLRKDMRSIIIPEDQWKYLSEVAERYHLSISALIRLWIDEKRDKALPSLR